MLESCEKRVGRQGRRATRVLLSIELVASFTERLNLLKERRKRNLVRFAYLEGAWFKQAAITHRSSHRFCCKNHR